MAGAAVAVAGVALGIGAVLMLTDDPSSDGPTVAQPPSSSLAVTASPTSPTSPTTPTTAPPTTRPPSVPVTAPVTAPVTSPVTPRPTPVTTTPAPRPTSTPRATPRPTATAAAKPPLTVLNNSRRTKLADRAAQQFRAAGYPIRDVGNFAGTIPRTTVYYAAGQLDAARRLARSFDVDRVLPRFDRLPGSGLTIVLTREYEL